MEAKAYNAYNVEDELEQSDIHLNPVRKSNSKRKYESFIGDGVKLIRKRIESVVSASPKDFQRIFMLSRRIDLN